MAISDVELKEILKTLQNSVNKIDLHMTEITNSLRYEIEYRKENQEKIKELEKDLEISKSEVAILKNQISVFESKLREVDDKIKDKKEFIDKFKENAWKAVWWILGIGGAVLGTYYSTIIN